MESWDISSLQFEPHHPQVLRSDEHSRAIAIDLPEGEQLQDHQTHEAAWLLVADGEVEIDGGGETQTAGPGFLAHFAAGERREVRAGSHARVVMILEPWPGEGHPSRRE
ncbi:MAG: cupin domain-containing protein [Thermoleophilaceae bacterium]|jgi:quercetin dioxygenase-like cupin family protein|nr:cupin domain-containing protein [Thermoleophilaceae bacterium]